MRVSDGTAKLQLKMPYFVLNEKEYMYVCFPHNPYILGSLSYGVRLGKYLIKNGMTMNLR